jgi:hypothetical protein
VFLFLVDRVLKFVLLNHISYSIDELDPGYPLVIFCFVSGPTNQILDSWSASPPSDAAFDDSLDFLVVLSIHLD